MDRKEFIENVTNAVERYLDDFELFEPDPQLSVNPVTHYVDVVSANVMQTALTDSEEAIENAANADNAADKEYTDFQVKENPDFYPIRTLLTISANSPTVANPKAIESLADKYF